MTLVPLELIKDNQLPPIGMLPVHAQPEAVLTCMATTVPPLASMTLTALPNTTGNAQAAYVSVGGQSVPVVQAATACTYSVTPTQVSSPASGTNGTLGVSASCPIVAGSNANWLTVMALS